jgi:hypothetical protein
VIGLCHNDQGTVPLFIAPAAQTATFCLGARHGSWDLLNVVDPECLELSNRSVRDGLIANPAGGELERGGIGLFRKHGNAARDAGVNEICSLEHAARPRVDRDDDDIGRTHLRCICHERPSSSL